MNQPDRYDRFAPREGESKVTFARDQKLPNAGVLSIMREDHTAGNLLRCALHEDPEVVFAGYRIPHPLEPLMEVRVQTTSGKTPVAAVSGALRRLAAEAEDLDAQWRSAVASLQGAAAGVAAAGGAQGPMPPHYQQQQGQQPYGGGGGGAGGGGYY